MQQAQLTHSLVSTPPTRRNSIGLHNNTHNNRAALHLHMAASLYPAKTSSPSKSEQINPAASQSQVSCTRYSGSRWPFHVGLREQLSDATKQATVYPGKEKRIEAPIAGVAGLTGGPCSATTNRSGSCGIFPLGHKRPCHTVPPGTPKRFGTPSNPSEHYQTRTNAT